MRTVVDYSDTVIFMGFVRGKSAFFIMVPKFDLFNFTEQIPIMQHWHVENDSYAFDLQHKIHEIR